MNIVPALSRAWCNFHHESAAPLPTPSRRKFRRARRSNRGTRRNSGLTLAEVAVVMGILAILLAIATPPYFRYRGRQAVNSAREMVDALVTRSREEAMSSGFPLPDELVASGISEIAPSGTFGADDEKIIARLRKRERAGEPPRTLSSRDLSQSVSIGVQTQGFGILDLDAKSELEGVFFELVSEKGGTTTLLASLPVEINGEFVLHQGAKNAHIVFQYNSYEQSLTVTRRGVITLDQP